MNWLFSHQWISWHHACPFCIWHCHIKLVIVWTLLQAHLLKCTKTMSLVKVPSYSCLVHLIQNLCLVTVKQILGCLICILWINLYFCRTTPKKTKDQKSIITLAKRLSQLCQVRSWLSQTPLLKILITFVNFYFKIMLNLKVMCEMT